MLILSVFMGIIGIGFLIGFHELGHFLFCKIFNIATPTFSIGMGPTLFKKKLGGTNFKLSAIPLGGYVEIAGEESQQDDENKIPDKYLFTSKPYYQKMLVIAGGIIFNMIFCYVALSFLFWTGMPQTPIMARFASPKINMVEENSPAAQAGLQGQDILLSIDGNPAEHNLSTLLNYIRDNPGKVINISYQSGESVKTAIITIGSQIIQNKNFGKLGISFDMPRLSFWQSIKQGIIATHYLAYQIGSSLLTFTLKNLRSLGGPLMVIKQTAHGAEKGFTAFLFMLAIISVNLAVLNIIPLPIMDGGQALFHTIEAIMRKPLPETIKMYIQYGSWLFVLILVILLSIRDVAGMIFK